jgi:hypothetical protein
MKEEVEIIDEEEWYKRVFKDKVYKILGYSFKLGWTQVLDIRTGYIYLVRSHNAGKDIIITLRTDD